MAKKLFCEISPFCFAISQKKENLKRHLKNIFGNVKFAKTVSNEKLPNVIYSHSSNMIKRAPGVNLEHQLNKAVNIDIACKKINGLIIKPGEEFSFWGRIGKASKRRGFKEGRIIIKNKLISGVGGGLCNLSNTIHLLILHSPLTVTEFHKHSDALAPDEGKRVPFSAGTSVSYNHVDYRFKNNTENDFQLCLWTEGELLCAELRSVKEVPYSYQLIEEDHHFAKKNDKFYRNSMIYREITEKSSGKVIDKELILKNHSEVMFDYDLIPKELIR